MNSVVKQRIADIQRGNVPAGYRKTKLGIIPADWSTPELNSVLTENKERNRSGRFGKEDVLSVSGEFGVTNQIELLGRSFAGASVKDYHIVEAGNIVYTKSPLKDNPYGIIKLNKGNAGIVSTLYAVYCCKSNEVGTYLDYYFSLDQNVNNYLRPLVRKGTKNDMKINNGDVLKGCVILPPESETAKIVEILGCCDRVIALKKELIAEKKKQKKALMQKLLNPDSGFRLPGFSGEWRKVYVSDVSELLTGYPFASENFSLTGTKLLRCSNVKRGVLDWDPSITVYWNYCENLDEFQLQAGDIVIAMDGALVGYSFSKITPDDLPMLLVQRVARLRSTGICQDYLAHCIINPAFGEHIERVKTDTAIPHMSPKDILGYAFYMPTCAKEQQAIADILSAADKEIDLLEQELAQQEQKKKSLMQLLLTGIVRM